VVSPLGGAPLMVTFGSGSLLVLLLLVIFALCSGCYCAADRRWPSFPLVSGPCMAVVLPCGLLSAVASRVGPASSFMPDWAL